MGHYMGKRSLISNISCIVVVSRNRRDFFMGLIRVIKKNNKETLLSPNNRWSRKIEHDIHDSRLWVNSLLFIKKIWGNK